MVMNELWLTCVFEKKIVSRESDVSTRKAPCQPLVVIMLLRVSYMLVTPWMGMGNDTRAHRRVQQGSLVPTRLVHLS